MQNTHLGANFYLSIDNSKDACCVDFISAAHVNSSLIIKFGESCFVEDLSKSKVEVIYIRNRSKLDTNQFLGLLKDHIQSPESEGIKNLYLFLDQNYHHYREDLLALIESEAAEGFDIRLIGYQQEGEKQNQFFLRFYSHRELFTEPCHLVFLGPSESHLLPIFFMQKEKFKIKKVFSFGEEEDKFSEVSIDSNRLLMKRYSLINKAKKAECFGIIVMNSHIGNYNEEISGLKQLLKRNKKKYFVFTMNKLNEAKIKNFPEVDVFVVISCPQSCFYDYREFYKVSFQSNAPVLVIYLLIGL